jgi:hypothetical protein
MFTATPLDEDCFYASIEHQKSMRVDVVDNQAALAYHLGIAVGALPMRNGYNKHRTVVSRSPWNCLCAVDFERLATKFRCSPEYTEFGVKLCPVLGRN